MTRVLTIAAIAFSVGFPSWTLAQSAPPDLVKQAIAAAGGEQALRGLKSLQISADAKHWEPDQSLIAGGPALFLGDSKLTMTWDLSNNAARMTWDRHMLAQGDMSYQEVVTPTYGFVTDDKGSRAMSSIRVAAQLRELKRAAPNLLIRMLESPGSTSFLGGVRTAEGPQPAMSFKDGVTTFTVIFSKKTRLPAIIRTQDDDSMRGTVNYDLRLEDWKSVNGAMVAHQLTYSVSDSAIARVNYTLVAANAPIDAAQFAPSDAVKAAAKPPASANVPYQWVLRRIALGRFLDSDQVNVPPGGSLRLVELAPKVQHVVGGTHNSLIVDLKDGLVVIDAPINDAQSRWTIDAARAKYGKPVKNLVLTHHHNDHSGGVRTYMGEGATIVVPVPTKKYFVKLALTERIVPDELQNKRISPVVEEVKDSLTLKDDDIQVRIIRIPNHHAEGMFIAHVMPANIVWVTDLWSPGGGTEKTAGLLALSDALRRNNITGATIAGGHGGTAPQSAVEAIVAAK
jgi:glyoxylase-like metal-dependent hydrolase (beta-lactamase superfamily II)